MSRRKPVEIRACVQVKLHLPTAAMVALSRYLSDAGICGERAGGSAPDPDRPGYSFSTAYYLAEYEHAIREWLAANVRPARRSKRYP
jgi:hypothetical protein